MLDCQHDTVKHAEVTTPGRQGLWLCQYGDCHTVTPASFPRHPQTWACRGYAKNGGLVRDTPEMPTYPGRSVDAVSVPPCREYWELKGWHACP